MDFSGGVLGQEGYATPKRTLDGGKRRWGGSRIYA